MWLFSNGNWRKSFVKLQVLLLSLGFSLPPFFLDFNFSAHMGCLVGLSKNLFLTITFYNIASWFIVCFAEYSQFSFAEYSQYWCYSNVSLVCWKLVSFHTYLNHAVIAKRMLLYKLYHKDSLGGDVCKRHKCEMQSDFLSLALTNWHSCVRAHESSNDAFDFFAEINFKHNCNCKHNFTCNCNKFLLHVWRAKQSQCHWYYYHIAKK